jgi:hypothetical protein
VICALPDDCWRPMRFFQCLQDNILCHSCFKPSSPNALIEESLPRSIVPEYGRRNVSWLFAAKIQASETGLARRQ